MPQILSFGEKNSKSSKDNIFKTIWEGFNSLDKFIRSYIIFAVLLILITPALTSAYLIFNTRAATSGQIGQSWSSSPDTSKPQQVGSSTQPQSPTSYPVDQEVINVLTELNNYRASYGLGALTPDYALTEAAKWMANDMASKNYFSHTDSLGRDAFTRTDNLGYAYNTWRGENLAAGSEIGSDAMYLWKTSSGHNANMLGSNYKAVGIYRAYNPNSAYGFYWVQDFGGFVASPVAYTPINNLPTGSHDGVDNTNCSSSGWVYDPDLSSASLNVHVYKDGPAGTGVGIGSYAANISRPDVNSSKNINGNHGFNITFNASSGLLDGREHSLYVYGIDSAGGTNAQLNGSPKTIICASPTPTPTPTPAINFSVTSSPTFISISPGESGKSSIAAALISGTSRAVSFSASGLPSGASVSFSPSSCTAPCTTKMSINTLATVTRGARTVTVIANGGGTTKSTVISLNVLAPTVDLIIQPSSIFTIPSIPVAGQLVSFSGVVKSQYSGINVIFSTRLRIDVGNNGTWDVNPANWSTGPFSANGTSTKTWSNAWTAQKGTHKIEICTDITNGVGETIESNNCLTKTFTVN